MSICSSALKVRLKTRRWCISLQIYADTIHPSNEHTAICTGASSALWTLPCPTDRQDGNAKTSWDCELTSTLSISSDVRTGDQVRSLYRMCCSLTRNENSFSNLRRMRRGSCCAMRSPRAAFLCSESVSVTSRNFSALVECCHNYQRRFQTEYLRQLQFSASPP